MNLLHPFLNLRLRYKLLISYSAAFIFAITLGSIIIYSLVAKGIEENIENELTSITSTILNMVRTTTAVSIRNHLRAIAEKNQEIVSDFHRQWKNGMLTGQEAMARSRSVFLSQSIGKTGYIFAWDIRNAPEAIPLAVHPKIQGEDLSYVDFVQEAARLKSGYMEYRWQNPDEVKPRDKAMYLSYFEPWQWVIAASSYRDEFIELVQMEDLRDSITSLKFGESGYVFVLDSSGNIVIHPNLKGNQYHVKDARGRPFMQEICKKKTGKIVYSWKNPEEIAFRDKLVVFDYIPEYDWIVASSGYLEEFYGPLNSIRNVIIGVSLAIVILFLLISFWIGSSVTKPLQELMNRFASGADGDLSIRMEEKYKNEIGQLSRNFNTFMERLEVYSRDLEAEISERIQVEDALKVSEEKYRRLYEESKRGEEVYRSLIDSSADAIVIYNLEKEVRYVSPSFSVIFGWKESEVKGKRIPFIPKSIKDRCVVKIEEVIQNGVPLHGFETKRLTKEGKILNVSISASRFNDHKGNPSGLLVTLRDITETRRLQSQLLQAQKIKSLGILAGGIAHDFNNLLMAIQGNASLIHMNMDEHNPHFEKVQNILELIKNATDLTRQLLAFARGGKYEVEPTNLNKIIKKSVEMFGRTKKEIKINEKYHEYLWTAEVDRGQIEQVLLNLFVNAANAMPNGGKLSVLTQNVVLKPKFVRPHLVEPGKYVQISVEDTGTGMDEETRQKVFEPFFTTKRMGRGTGLGLASAYGIMKHHNGIINVYSEKGKGTKFDLYLPASEKAVKKDESTEVGILKGSGKILLVDDEEFIRDITSDMLSVIGYDVISVDSGKKAVEIYMKEKESIDMIILDMIMPDMGGGETFDALKKINPDAKVLLASGYSIDGKAGDILKRGCNGFIQKPFDLIQLSQKSSEVLKGDCGVTS
ncbi:MAG TPA: cache domain-containing protein [Desulfobacteraceae bacterium]|nr:cache domain-containing protein [Desulfobacteraceae bacterium]HPJ67531.1 cache domain-containing protein [Desulfobacteraceae bacterium]